LGTTELVVGLPWITAALSVDFTLKLSVHFAISKGIVLGSHPRTEKVIM